jgi:serine-type D-Ala-D-Ala carboxypeptidase (penicillin-binding protein 5/6)
VKKAMCTRATRSFVRCCLLFFAFAMMLNTLSPDVLAAPKKTKHVQSTRQTATVREKEKEVSGPICKAEILLEASSGDVLYEQNVHEMLPPASMAKMMLLYVVMKKLDEGMVRPTDVITASAFASKVGGSQVYLKQGEQFTLEQLLEAVVIHSANDAATAIAEHIGGSSEGFVDMMNMEAESLGLKEAQFYSPHGLPPGKGQKADMISAYDLALLARAIVAKYPKILELSRKESSTFRDGKLVLTNTNHLVRKYPGCDGLKTGYYVEAGFGVTATAVRNGTRMIAVAMGCRNGKQRFDEAARLLSLGFSQYKLVRLLDKGAPASQPVPVVNGEKIETVPVAAAEVVATVKPGDQKNIVRRESLCSELKAPVVQNSPCGSVAFMLGDKEISRGEMVAAENIPPLRGIGRALRLLHLK